MARNAADLQSPLGLCGHLARDVPSCIRKWSGDVRGEEELQVTLLKATFTRFVNTHGLDLFVRHTVV